ncbi:methyltransferase family protein [Actinocrispum wychmicini]|uniref:Protein-S-isoprenylcysteine O-methyltransferase Ste14 n=1 Tax=Actinocrispum wychmicini TaxID=1213861 RepID=A0A4V2S686_9PSEU|nr:isoprenylcysteine carboxylmethyltransferase family protein [Actinocrispum wychmicini]TCO55090.1 protein-S-isoprenylcysteine O-methyltransferase Ste14 [Actinocrispum wychmicini]
MRNRVVAAAGSAVFFVLAPGIVAGLLPWLITRWQVEPIWPPLRVLGWVVLVPSVAVLVSAFVRFVVEGFGTPAPVAPPEKLVVGGFYRYVRNPMYLCVLGAIVGQALVFGQPWVLAYALAVSAAFYSMVHWHEEPSLRRNFGNQYDTYRNAVPGWLPRLRPWQPPSASS